MKKVTLFALGITTVSAASGGSQAKGDAFEEEVEVQGHKWDYRDNGASWGTYVAPECDGRNQSPIDLASPKEVMAQKFYPIISSEVDMIKKDYNNLKGAEIHWNGHTSQMNIHNLGVYNRFEKKITGQEFENNFTYYDGPKAFNAVQFHFHSGSEHTIDGYRYDLEMHTVHTAHKKDEEHLSTDGEKIGHAAVGIIFDTKYYTARLSWSQQRVIDNFFDSLKWDNVTGNPKIDVTNYGVLMTMVDFNNRYTYKGSVTTPPCATYVHWNVLSTVYPISEKHLKQFKEQLKRNTEQQPPLSVTGNWRKTQNIDFHDVKLIKSDVKQNNGEYYAIDQSGELYLLEGARDKKWLNEIEASRYTLEETKPGQYHYVSTDQPEQAPANNGVSLPTVSLPTISLLGNAAQLIVSLAASASILMTQV